MILSFGITLFFYLDKNLRYSFNYENIIKFLLIYMVFIYVVPLIIIISFKSLTFIFNNSLFFFKNDKSDEKPKTNELKMISMLISVFSYIVILYVVITRNVFNINDLLISQMYLKIPALILVILISFFIIIFFFYFTLFLLIENERGYYNTLVEIICLEIFSIVFGLIEIIAKIISDVIEVLRIIPDFIGDLSGLLGVDRKIKEVLDEMYKQRKESSEKDFADNREEKNE